MATASQKQVARTANGQFRPGVSGNASGNVHRSRHALNADTIREMHAAFRQGGREAIDKVMRTQPAAFLKLLVLLVPREMKVEHSGGREGDDAMSRWRRASRRSRPCSRREAGDSAKVIEAVPKLPRCLRPARPSARFEGPIRAPMCSPMKMEVKMKEPKTKLNEHDLAVFKRKRSGARSTAHHKQHGDLFAALAKRSSRRKPI